MWSVQPISSAGALLTRTGDLGLNAKDVENKLQTAFELAQAWDCVLLLDEADVFLASRTADNIERNALVSGKLSLFPFRALSNCSPVFLRVLEYYDGILFLTTNRVGAFDEAFKSRVHMALYYPPLSWSQTEQLWRSQIRRAKKAPYCVTCDEVVLLSYAEQLYNEQSPRASTTGPVWNGRQIRNAFQSAIALAKFGAADNEPVRVEKEHFEKVAKVSDEFNDYLLRVKNEKNDADLAKDRLLRDDRYLPGGHLAETLPVYRPQPIPVSSSRPEFGKATNGFAQQQSAPNSSAVQFAMSPQYAPMQQYMPQGMPMGMQQHGFGPQGQPMYFPQQYYHQTQQAIGGAQQPQQQPVQHNQGIQISQPSQSAAQMPTLVQQQGQQITQTQLPVGNSLQNQPSQQGGQF